MSITLADREENIIDSGFRSNYPGSSRAHSRSLSTANPNPTVPETAFGTLVQPTVARAAKVKIFIAPGRRPISPALPVQIPSRTPIKDRLRSGAHSQTSSFGKAPTPLNLEVELPTIDDPLLTGLTIKPLRSAVPVPLVVPSPMPPRMDPPTPVKTPNNGGNSGASTSRKRDNHGKEKGAPVISPDKELSRLREALKEKEDIIKQFCRERETEEQRRAMETLEEQNRRRLVEERERACVQEEAEKERTRAHEAIDAAFCLRQEEEREEFGTLPIEAQYNEWMQQYRSDPTPDSSLMSRISRLPLHLNPFHVRERSIRTEKGLKVIYEMLVEHYQNLWDIQGKLQRLLDMMHRLLHPNRARYIIDNANLYITPLQHTFPSQDQIRAAYALARGRIFKGTEFLEKWLYEFKGIRQRSALSVDTRSKDLSPILRKPEDDRLPHLVMRDPTLYPQHLTIHQFANINEDEPFLPAFLRPDPTWAAAYPPRKGDLANVHGSLHVDEQGIHHYEPEASSSRKVQFKNPLVQPAMTAFPMRMPSPKLPTFAASSSTPVFQTANSSYQYRNMANVPSSYDRRAVNPGSISGLGSTIPYRPEGADITSHAPQIPAFSIQGFASSAAQAAWHPSNIPSFSRTLSSASYPAPPGVRYAQTTEPNSNRVSSGGFGGGGGGGPDPPNNNDPYCRTPFQGGPGFNGFPPNHPNRNNPPNGGNGGGGYFPQDGPGGGRGYFPGGGGGGGYDGGGGGGGYPGYPDPAQLPYPMMPYLKPEMKRSDLPTWDGKEDTAIEFFYELSRIASISPMVDRTTALMGRELFDKDSDVRKWYDAQDDTRRVILQQSLSNLIRAIRDEVLTA